MLFRSPIVRFFSRILNRVTITRALLNLADFVSLVQNVMSPDESIISSVDVPVVREIRVNPNSTCLWKMI